jgi:hypothetical protein
MILVGNCISIMHGCNEHGTCVDVGILEIYFRGLLHPLDGIMSNLKYV